MGPRTDDPILKQRWQKLVDLRFEADGAALTFTNRLARENGWSAGYARRVVEEYRRFVFLASAAGHQVTPSDEVDQAWHLHLTYTRSYWDEMCGRILERPLHHGPTMGGPVEQVRFEDQYERTLDSYRAWFGTEPPVDIWPPASVRFGRACTYRRVSSDDLFLVPKPAVLRRWPVSADGRTPAAVAVLSVAPLLLLTAVAMLAVDVVDAIMKMMAVGAFIVVIAIWLMVSSLSKPERPDAGVRRRRSGGGFTPMGFLFWGDSDGGHDSGDGGGSGCGGAGCGGGGCGGGGCGGGCGG